MPSALADVAQLERHDLATLVDELELESRATLQPGKGKLQPSAQTRREVELGHLARDHVDPLLQGKDLAAEHVAPFGEDRVAARGQLERVLALEDTCVLTAGLGRSASSSSVGKRSKFITGSLTRPASTRPGQWRIIGTRRTGPALPRSRPGRSRRAHCTASTGTTPIASRW